MTRKQAIKRFGSVRKIADALGITVGAVYQWPRYLPQRLVDEINGAAARLGIDDEEKESPRGVRARLGT